MNTKDRDKYYNGKDSFWLPNHKVEALASSFLPAIREYFETADGQDAFAAWQQEQTEPPSTSGVKDAARRLNNMYKERKEPEFFI